jgi:hypothetical protein
MSKVIQVRDVPEQLPNTLKARAAREGMSLSDFIKRELESPAERPTMREWLELTKRAKPIPAKRSAAQIVRVARCAMIVLDASIVVELLGNGVFADSLRRALAASSDSFVVPHLLDVEVTSAFEAWLPAGVPIRIALRNFSTDLHRPRRALFAHNFAWPHLRVASQLTASFIPAMRSCAEVTTHGSPCLPSDRGLSATPESGTTTTTTPAV